MPRHFTTSGFATCGGAESGDGLRAQRRAVAPGCGGGVAWGAAMNIMPWEFYVHYGDRDLLAGNYDAMKEQIRFMQNWVATTASC